MNEPAPAPRSRRRAAAMRPAGSSSPSAARFSPELYLTLDALSRKEFDSVEVSMQSFGFKRRSTESQPLGVVVFCYCDGDGPEAASVAALGVTMNQEHGPVRTAIVPVDALAPLAELPGVRGLVLAEQVHGRMDIAGPYVRLPNFRAAAGSSGRGVLVGVVDSGIDAAHNTFSGRILRIWDQTLPSAPGGAVPYGRELTGPNMLASPDTHGHGTHVAGIAAGADPTYLGVAPDADLVIVKTDFLNAHIADGVRYVFDLATRLGRPAVVNLSLGGHGDPHDGSDGLSRQIDALSGPGRIVCCAAGNEGNDNIHAARTVPAGGELRMRFMVPPTSLANVRINVWLEGGADLALAVSTPGKFVTPYAPPGPGAPAITSLPDARVQIVNAAAPQVNGAFQAVVRMLGPTATSPVTGGLWQLLLRNVSGVDRHVDAWILDDQASAQAVFTGQSVADSMKIGAPGAATQAVTVAAFTTRNSWTDVGGAHHAVGLAADSIADFSSEGPRRDGGEKPDIAAPGAMIASAMSTLSTVEPAYSIAPGFVLEAGTSMATPFVAGLVALLLERDPALDPPAVKARLRAAASSPGWDPKSGHGLVDASRL